MLNELRDLSRSLNEDNIPLEKRHEHFENCKRSNITCFIYLNNNGDISGFDFADYDVRKIRKWEKSNGCSFPAFNIPSLYKVTDEVSRDAVIKIRKKLKKEIKVSVDDIQKLAESASGWGKNDIKKINSCFSQAISEIEEKLGEVPSEYLSIQVLCERAKKQKADNFHQQLKNQIFRKLNESFSSDLLDMLFQTSNTSKNIQIICDISDWRERGSEYPPNHPAVQAWMNSRFLHFSEKKRLRGKLSLDAFGDNAIGYEEKLPSVRMSILGDVILRAMNKESPCQKRYGMIDASSFPIGDNVRKEMQGALYWLSDDSRKNKTWIDLTKKVDGASILFAYPTKKPKTVPELAGLMGGVEGDTADTDGATFSAIASRVTQTLRGISTGASDNEIRIFVLAKRPGDARTKVVVSKRYTADHTIKSAEQWQEGCRNIPNIQIRQFENGTSGWKDCLFPFPAEVIWCLNTAWRRQGTYAERVHGFSINDALSLLLDDGNEVRRLAHRAIDAIVRNCASLILALGQKNASGRDFKITKKYEKQALLLPSILGLLLYKNEIEKGGFMNSPAYLVGRFLSLVDDLHLKYCQQVRKGSIPHQLIGNALMPTALETPVKALSMLSQRILPYQAWAETLSGDEKDAGLVKYFLKQIGEVSNQLKEEELSPTCSDTDKAQMLLGYLAWSEKSE